MKAIAIDGFTHTRARVAWRVISILFFTAATALAAQVKIPVPGTLVPATLQTAIVILAGLRLGSRDGAISQILYVAGGSVGLPFFAGAAGFAALFGPTGGYLFGFILAAWCAGYLSKHLDQAIETTYLRTWMIALLSSLVLFVPGVLQLKLFLHLNMTDALMMGFVPFIVGDVLKVTLSTTIHRLTRRYFY